MTLHAVATSSVRVKVASISSFLVMKGMALGDRMKEEDAWDIYYCVQNYPGELDALVDELRPNIEHSMVKEGFTKIAGAFASEKHVGPT
jgi:predicted nucleotidyltransferase